jgi:hypothetical protein
LPLPDLRQKANLNLEKDQDYNQLIFAYENNYSEKERLPDNQALATEIAYDYLLLVVQSILQKLSEFPGHSGFEELFYALCPK